MQIAESPTTASYEPSNSDTLCIFNALVEQSLYDVHRASIGFDSGNAEEYISSKASVLDMVGAFKWDPILIYQPRMRETPIASGLSKFRTMMHNTEKDSGYIPPSESIEAINRLVHARCENMIAMVKSGSQIQNLRSDAPAATTVLVKMGLASPELQAAKQILDGYQKAYTDSLEASRLSKRAKPATPAM